MPVGFGWRYRYGYPALPPTTVFGLRSYRRMSDTVKWLIGTRETLAIDAQGNPASGGGIDFVLNGGSPQQVEFNRAYIDPWDIGQTNGTSSNILVQRSSKAHCNGWWLWSFQVNVLGMLAGERLYAELACKVGDVEHIMSRYEVGNTEATGILEDQLMSTSFVFNFARFDQAYDVQVIARVYTDSDRKHDVDYSTLSGIALCLQPPPIVAPGSHRYTPMTRWTSGPITSGMVNAVASNLQALAADRIVVDLEKTGTETIADGVVGSLNWEETYDPYGWHSTSTNRQRITVDTQTRGVALVMATFTYPVALLGGPTQLNTAFGIAKNGVTMVQEQTVQTNLPGGLMTWVGTIVDVAPGDYFTTVQYQNHGGPKEVGTLNLGAWFTARFVLVMLTAGNPTGSPGSFVAPDELTVGSAFGPTEFNKLVDATAFFATERPGGRWLSSIPRPLPSDAWTTANLDWEAFDHGNMHVSDDGFFWVPAGFSGWWIVSANAAFSGGDGVYGLGIAINGGRLALKVTTSKDAPMLVIPPTPIHLNAGDQVALHLYQFNVTGTAHTYGALDTTGYGCCLAAQFETFGW